MKTPMPIKEESLQHSHNQNPLPNPLMRDATWWKRKSDVDEESSASLSPIFGILRRRIGVIAGIAMVTATTAAIWAASQTAKYEGRFQILVEPLKTSDSELLKLLSQTLQQNVNEITKQNTTALDYNALMEVLKSPKLIDPVVQELLPKYPNTTYDHMVGGDVPSGKVAPGRLGTLYITRLTKGKDESRVIEVRYRDLDPEKVEIVLDRVSQAYRKYSIEQQQTNLRQGMRFIEQQIPKIQLRVNTLQGQMQLFQQHYGLYNPQLQSEQLLKRLDDAKTQRLEVERKLAEARSLYGSLQNQLGMQQNAAIAASALSESPQYQQILTRIREVEAKIATESVKYNEASPIMQDLREQREKLLPLLNQEQRLALGNNNNGEPLPSQVGTYQNSIRRELTQQLANTTNQVQSLTANLQTLVQSEAQMSEQIRQYPVVARQHTNLQRDLQVSTDTLNQLLAKQEALRVDNAQQDVPWELIMPPTLPRDKKGDVVPITPSPTSTAMMGGIGGLLLGALAAFAIENRQNVFYDPEDAKRAGKLPLLGSIPYYRDIHKPAIATNVARLQEQLEQGSKSQVKFSAQAEKEALFAQSFCSIYNRIQAYSVESQVRSITVTSTAGKEGKSTVALQLALIAAQAGQRVLLVDANFRHPQLHESVGLVNTKGLSEILGDGLDLNDVIGQVPREENLFIVTAGQLTQNSSKLLASEKMREFIERSHNEFNLVIYDAPNILGRVDTNILTTHTDGIVLVVGLGKTLRPNLKKLVEELKATRTTVLGMVTNTLVS
ncbi:GumC family protein [Calothrix sp. PCC 6303]|uniref:GumC family protein n=1 Tax=Calothrix sp. PCC 6303 TaxID=1170562 RepID=UPI001EF10478|nr:tyrosine-protein kinase domain-containing protein [Calothrix sp. PCC 6303]